MKTALAMVAAEKPDILNHNIETVQTAVSVDPPTGEISAVNRVTGQGKTDGHDTKSGLILGMGETMDEARDVMRDLRSVECDIMTIGQYLQPTKSIFLSRASTIPTSLPH